MEEHILNLLRGYFANEEAVQRWLSTPNPALGGSTPKALIETGRGQKLATWIEKMLAREMPQVSAQIYKYTEQCRGIHPNSSAHTPTYPRGCAHTHTRIRAQARAHTYTRIMRTRVIRIRTRVANSMPNPKLARALQHAHVYLISLRTNGNQLLTTLF